jgi:hypothetical protein
VLSSDSDVASYRPMDTISSAMLRRTRAGAFIGSDQVLTLEEALYAHTIDAARALFLEDRLGSLEPGKLADIAVFDQDLTRTPAEELAGLEARMTFLGGRLEHGSVRSGLPAG